ncbi:MAG: hypothetical protein JW822_09820 [Spirochaetales bacterium]|nr:hypothetical protein [Spirochaetales bacterium]
MLRKICAVLGIFIFIGSGAFANIGLPVQEPPPSGDVFASGGGLTALRLEHEKLILDLTRREAGFSHARYTIRNTAGGEISTDLIFITPYMYNVSVSVNSQEIEIQQENIPFKKLPWKPVFPESWGREEIPAYRFHVSFPGNTETVVEVMFRLPAGYDNRAEDMGLHMGEAAHALNWAVESDSTVWYLYNLDAAGTFSGGIRRLDVEIIIPENDDVEVNIPLVQGKTANGVKSFTGSFAGMPAPYIEAKRKHEAVYSMFGGSAGGGLVTNYVDYTEFMAQAMVDFYFYNHQLSAGVEGNPFGTGIKFPVIYTFILGDKVHPYFAFFGDLRLSAGALFELSPESAVGFRISGGMRFTMMILEIAYDFYPFDTDKGYIGRMTFLYKISL